MIHKFSINGIYIVMDIESGAVHVVDEVVYTLLDDFAATAKEELIRLYRDRFTEEQITEAVDELEELKKNGMLFTQQSYQDVLPIMDSHQPVVKALCLHVAHDCNLKCRYCFAEEGEYHGKRSLMSYEVGKAAIDFLIRSSGSRKNLEVDFFGGEPLMNFEVVKALVAYGREQEKQYHKNFRFTITTNGVLLDEEKCNYINHTMHNVVLSLDGRKQINDLMRPKAGAMGSYDTIVPKFLELTKNRKGKDYYVRGTFTKNNLDFASDVLHMADLGFDNVSVEPVVAQESMPYAILPQDLETIEEEYEKLALALYERKKEGKGVNFFHFNIDLSGGPCVIKRLSGCGSGTQYLAVTPEGDLYPCHQFVGMEEFKMGTVFEGVYNTALREEFAKCNVYAKPDCRECWARFYCSGGCAANAYQYGGGLLSTYQTGCRLQKKRIECAIMLKAMELSE